MSTCPLRHDIFLHRFAQSGLDGTTSWGAAHPGYDVASIGGTGAVVGGVQADGVGASGSCLAVAPDDKLVSVLGTSFKNTPSILPVRGHLDSIKCLMKGDLYIGRGCRQRGVSCSQFANPYKVPKFGRSRSIELFSTFLQDNAQLRSALWTFSGLRLVCHCGPQQPCHADILISAFSHSL